MERQKNTTRTVYSERLFYKVEGKPEHIKAMQGDYREPKKGEYYLSGAQPMAYLALNDISQKYYIANLVTVQTVRKYIATDYKGD